MSPISIPFPFGEGSYGPHINIFASILDRKLRRLDMRPLMPQSQNDVLTGGLLERFVAFQRRAYFSRERGDMEGVVDERACFFLNPTAGSLYKDLCNRTCGITDFCNPSGVYHRWISPATEPPPAPVYPPFLPPHAYSFYRGTTVAFV